tara:strand:+ start:3184 stop:4863 length:1680 start_codon:yes stop_codon:yes gene_type:complete
MMTADCRALLLKMVVIAGWALGVPAAVAQTGAPPSSQLELRRSAAGNALAGAMSELAKQPRDLDALLIAGEAALRLEDPRSALGFFGRADDVSPKNGRVKAGLGRSMLQLDQVGDGLRLMEEAGTLGYSDPDLYADRGLARDLTGNQAGAQRDYQEALRLDPDNETILRRYAISLGISGQLDLAETTIKPLLYASNRAAWRDRAFILAMNGKTAEALDITNKVMPKPLAEAIKPYMERMAMLSSGQRAAAVHMGQFPPGLVNMRIASVAVPVKAAEPEPVNDGKRKKQKAAKAQKPEKAPTRVAAAAPAPPPPQYQPQPQPQRESKKEAVAATQPARPPASTSPVQEKRSVMASAYPRPVQGPPAPERASPMAAASSPASAAAAPAAPAAEPVESTRTLADIMAEIKIPEAERKPTVKPVNLAEIMAMQAKERKAEEAAAKEAARKQAAEEAKAKAKAEALAEKKRLAANPARYWLQIGIGRNKGALGFTLKRMQKEHDVLAKYDGWSASWGQTNRLVVGPFSTLDKAKAAESTLRKAGSDAFVWRSDAGEELERVGGK